MRFQSGRFVESEKLLEERYDLALLSFDPAQSVQLRLHHLFYLFTLLLDLSDRGANADGRHVDDIRGATEEGKALPFGDDEKWQRQGGRIDAAGVKPEILCPILPY